MKAKKFCDDIYAMELHEIADIQYSASECNFEIIRVPGGWLYRRYGELTSDNEQTTVFVPFDNEFQPR